MTAGGAPPRPSPAALPADAPPALELRALTRRFAGARPAVDAVSLVVRRGELLALVGASGSGKTTTLRMVAGYEQPDGGAVLLDGRDITALPPDRRGFGMVFQHYALFPHMTVEENVAFGLEARGVSRRERLDRARAALDAVGLEGAGRRPVQALSGGEQQRVALARATVIEPRVLLLDEPLSNLDPTLRESTREELRAMLHRLQLTALFVTHDQEDAFAIADRVALLERGVLLQVGAPEELYDRPASRAVARFIGRSTLVPAVLSGAEACVTLGGVQQRAPARAARGGELAALRDAGYTLAVLRPEMLSLVAADAAGAWPGRVVARRFVGALTVCRVAVDERTTLEVATPTRDVAEGDAVGVRLAGETVPMVPA